MAKDPAALFFIANWLTATKEMKADCRGWFLNLVLHQFDKHDLPNDIEELANLADVRLSEYDRFKEVYEQVLKHKFKQKENGRIENEFAKSIIQARENFKDKRRNAGKISYFMKFARKKTDSYDLIKFATNNINFDELDCKNEQMLEQVFKQVSELYINTNTIINKKNNTVLNGENPKTEFPVRLYTDIKKAIVAEPEIYQAWRESHKSKSDEYLQTAIEDVHLKNTQDGKKGLSAEIFLSAVSRNILNGWTPGDRKNGYSHTNGLEISVQDQIKALRAKEKNGSI